MSDSVGRASDLTTATAASDLTTATADRTVVYEAMNKGALFNLAKVNLAKPARFYAAISYCNKKSHADFEVKLTDLCPEKF